MELLYTDNRIVVCLKPAGVLSTDEPGGMPELLRRALGEDERGERTKPAACASCTGSTGPWAA